MLFKNRQHAGQLLVDVLRKYQSRDDTVVIGLARGGVVVAYEISQDLNLPLDIICARKIGAPSNHEFAIGAITETGESILDNGLIKRLHVTDSYLKSEIRKEKEEAARRLTIYKNGRPSLNLKDKMVILVDDGIATGATMKAAIQSTKAKYCKGIIVAVPVAPPDTLDEIRDSVDEVICLAAPIFFQAVGQFYENFSQTTDEEVIHLLL